MARSYSLLTKKYNTLLCSAALALCIALTAPASPANAQDSYRMGVTTSEKNSNRVNLPNILNKQDDKSPFLNHIMVSTQSTSPDSLQEEAKKAAEEAKDVIQEAKGDTTGKNKNEKESVEASSSTGEKNGTKKEETHEPSELSKKLRAMGINAGSMTNAVFLRHMVVHTND